MPARTPSAPAGPTNPADDTRYSDPRYATDDDDDDTRYAERGRNDGRYGGYGRRGAADEYDDDYADDYDEDDDEDADGDDDRDGGVIWRATTPLAPPIPAPRPSEPAATSPVGRLQQGPPQPAPGKRVRVVLAERKAAARPVRTVVDIQGDSPVGEALRTGLISDQLRVALRFALFGGLTLGVLPLVFYVLPDIGMVAIFGLRLPWLLLGILVYPFLFGLGWWFTRRAEQVEQDFADHVQDS